AETVEAVDYKSNKWKRKSTLEIAAQHDGGSWWWNTRIGRLDYVRFRLVSKNDNELLASLTLVGLDQYSQKWTTKAIGLTDIHVAEHQRRQGLGRLLVTETLRRLKQESINLIETHTTEGDVALTGLLVACGFQRVDAGTQYQATDFPAH
ncbi:MAG: GNAT family N-acetyltransferase, partial [Planctomycetaceae bacterium]